VADYFDDFAVDTSLSGVSGFTTRRLFNRQRNAAICEDDQG
jgi:hypothetical protein